MHEMLSVIKRVFMQAFFPSFIKMKLVGGWTFIKDNLEVKHVVVIRKQWFNAYNA